MKATEISILIFLICVSSVIAFLPLKNHVLTSHLDSTLNTKILPSAMPSRLYGINDFFNKILANDENLPPASNPGLKKEKIPATVEFLPAKVTVTALPGTKLKDVARSANVPIKYKCQKGECNTCAVKVNGIPGKACMLAIPNTVTRPGEKFIVEVIN